MKRSLRLRVVDLSVKELRKRIRVSDEELGPAIPFLRALVPHDPRLPLRLCEAVARLAELRPVLAFRLMGKEDVPQLFEHVHNQLASLGVAQQLAELERLLSTSILMHIDELLLELARVHGIRRWWEVRRVLTRDPELPKEFTALIDASAPPDHRLSA